MRYKEELINELVSLYESVIHGSDEHYGLLDCYDTYYKGVWDDKLGRIQELKAELKK